MPSIFAGKQERYADTALRLQEAAERETDAEAAMLYSRAWGEAFTASRHVGLEERNRVAALDARERSSYYATRRDERTAEMFTARAVEFDAIANRHRNAAAARIEKAAELERDAEASKAPVAAAPPPQPVRRPAPAPQRPPPPPPPVAESPRVGAE